MYICAHVCVCVCVNNNVSDDGRKRNVYIILLLNKLSIYQSLTIFVLNIHQYVELSTTIFKKSTVQEHS